jgi:hypothetical protein
MYNVQYHFSRCSALGVNWYREKKRFVAKVKLP